MRVPDIGAGPAQIFGILAGTAAEFLQRIGDVFVVFGQMCVQHHTLVTGKNGRVAHQVATDREGRTRGHAHPQHRPFAGVVVCVDHADAVVQDVLFAFDQSIGWQSAITFADAHRAARGMKAHPDLVCCGNRVVQPRAVGVKIQVIRGQRAARQRQFGQPDLGRGEHLFRAKARPDRIERLQPAEEQRVLSAGHCTGQGLVKMVMGVHQSRCDDAACGVDGF